MDWRDAEREYTDEVIGESTIPRLFEDSAARNADGVAQRYKGGVYDRSLTPGVLPTAPGGGFEPIDYRRMRSIVRHLAAGFRELGLVGGQRVAIFADTRMEWAQADFAVLAAGGVVTTAYPGSSADRARYLLADPGAKGVVVENEELLDRVLAVEDDLDLEFLVAMDRVDRARDDVHTLAEVHDRGEAAFDPDDYEHWLDARDLDSLASLIYTSGTTGQPKGVRLTHRNLRSNVNQVRKRFGPRPDREGGPVIDEHTRVVSFLPLAHVFERLAGHFLMFASGASVAYAEGPDTLREDFQAVRPTTGTSVPRVYEKIYDAARSRASGSAIKRRIFEWAVDVGRTYHETDSPGAGLLAKRALADRLVFGTVRESLGGEVDFLISGGGSLSPELCSLYYGMGLPIYEGYGLTETSPVVSVNPPEAPKVGTIGPPVVDCDVRIDPSVATREQRRDRDGEVGELLVRGPNVARGYWKQPDQTDAAFARASKSDGSFGTVRPKAHGVSGRWFRTGDIVELRPDGYLAFLERAKRLLVLSTGKNVAPGPIEDAFATSDVVEQCVVLGDGRRFVAALIVPNLDAIREWAERTGRSLPDDPEAACRDEDVRSRIQEEVDRVNRGFEEHERIKRFRLVPEEFTEENDLLTPTMKKKRRNILERYAKEIEAIYAE